MNETPPQVNPWIVALSVVLATFMEVLDTTATSTCIPHIAGNLSATETEGTWVMTSYLVANAIILPMTGWLARFFGRKRFQMVCVAGFTFSSILCGLAPSLGWLIFFRVIQGATGGGMIPISQAILLETFPPEKHGQAMAAFGAVVVLAPILGPTLGGWLTDNYTWRWIFYINVPVGIAALMMIQRFVFDPPYLRRPSERVDLWGIAFLTLGFGTLQVILDTGQREDWFASPAIRTWTLLCVTGFVLLIIRELTIRNPVVDLRALADRTFSTGVFLMAGVAFILYASLILLPIYLQTLMGYPALQSGLALSPRGLGALLGLPVSGTLVQRVDARFLIVFGMVLGSLTLFDLAGLNLYAGYWDIFWPQVIQGFAMSFLFVPLMAASMSHVAKEKMGNATSIFNVMRNIGGSFGIAIMTTLLTRRQQLHQSHLVSHISGLDPETQQLLAAGQQWFIAQGADPVTAQQRAYGAIYGMVHRQGAMLSFVEMFWLMAVLFLALAPLLLLLRRPVQRAPAAVD